MDRRMFLTASVCSAATIESACAKGRPSELQLVEPKQDFDYARFAGIVGRSADVRQLWDIDEYGTRPLGAIKTAYNAYQFDFAIAPARIAIAACLHGYGNALAYNDAMWAKYDIGRTFGLKDPTGRALSGNVLYHASTQLNASDDPNDPRSAYQDISLETLARRGVIVLACYAAAAEHAHELVEGNAAPAGMNAADVLADLQANLMPGSSLVPSMVATIGILQNHFSYAYTAAAPARSASQ
jgi:hypothetical protein